MRSPGAVVFINPCRGFGSNPEELARIVGSGFGDLLDGNFSDPGQRLGRGGRQAQDAELAQDRVSVAIDHVQVLLEPSQQQLPHELTSVLENAINTWGSGELEMTSTYLNHAIELAQELGYL